MKAISLKIRNYAGGISIVEDGNLASRILSSILISTGVLALCYVVILGTMVFNIVERRNLESKIRTLSGEVGQLELDFLALSNNIDLNFSRAMGFEEPEVKFAPRKRVGSVKMDKNEI